MSELSHFNEHGDAHMVDVGAKAVTAREAIAEGHIEMQAATLARVRDGGAGKGDVINVARIAGIMAAKRTADLIPLCHPLTLSRVEVDFRLNAQPPAVHCRARVSTSGQTGVEMEALTAVQIALLTIYDMCKAMDRGMSIQAVRLLEKSGGRSGAWRRPAD